MPNKGHGEKINSKKEKFPAKSFTKNKSCQKIVSGSSLESQMQHSRNSEPCSPYLSEVFIH